MRSGWDCIFSTDLVQSIKEKKPEEGHLLRTQSAREGFEIPLKARMVSLADLVAKVFPPQQAWENG